MFSVRGWPGFKILGIRDGVARVQLLGKIGSGGSTFTIANDHAGAEAVPVGVLGEDL